jgi:hypothetical protein
MSRSTVGAPVATAFSPTPTAASARRHLVSIIAVCLSGVLITAGLSYRVLHKPGVYLAQVNVLFLPPKSGLQPNALLSNSESLVSVAGAVGKMVDPDPTASHIVSPMVNLANEGVRTGYSVSLPNDGGQFANNFDRALLNVQVVAPTATQAVGTTQRLVDEINSKLTTWQDDNQVPAIDQIQTSLNPARIQEFHLTGSRVRAGLATIGLGLALTVAAMIVLPRRLARWQPSWRRPRAS